MNFWATIEHTLRYKYDGDYPDEIQHRLERAAEAAYLLMRKCPRLRMKFKRHKNIILRNVPRNMKMTNEV